MIRGGSLAPALSMAIGVLPAANGGTGSSGANVLLFVLRSANFQSTADQAFTKAFTGTNYVITNVVANTKTGGATVAVLGGIYSAASKGIPVAIIGMTGADSLTLPGEDAISIAELRQAHEGWLPAYMAAQPA